MDDDTKKLANPWRIIAVIFYCAAPILALSVALIAYISQGFFDEDVVIPAVTALALSSLLFVPIGLYFQFKTKKVKSKQNEVNVEDEWTQPDIKREVSPTASLELNCYLGIDGERRGPMSEKDIQNMYLQYKISERTKFFRNGMKEWVPLYESGIIIYIPALEDDDDGYDGEEEEKTDWFGLITDIAEEVIDRIR
jgi:hypothetical protein